MREFASSCSFLEFQAFAKEEMPQLDVTVWEDMWTLGCRWRGRQWKHWSVDEQINNLQIGETSHSLCIATSRRHIVEMGGSHFKGKSRRTLQTLDCECMSARALKSIGKTCISIEILWLRWFGVSRDAIFQRNKQHISNLQPQNIWAAKERSISVWATWASVWSDKRLPDTTKLGSELNVWWYVGDGRALQK